MPYLSLSCCLGMEPVLLTSEYLALCRPALQHSGRVRPVSELPKCVRGVLPAVIEMKVLPVQQRTALHQARSGCQACCPFLLRRGGGNGHGPAPVLTNKRTGNRSVCCYVSHSSVVVMRKQTKELYEPQTEYF